MMLHFTDEERKLYDIIHEKNGVKATEDEKEKALERFTEIGREKSKNNPFHQD
jgi:hypothetical protein